MQRAALLVLVAACGGSQVKEHAPELTKNLPATLEADRPRTGDPRVAKVRVWVDPGIRALPHWKEEITEQIDYASQLLTPLAGARLQVESFRDWPRVGEPHDALRALVEADKGDGVSWVIGYITPGDGASKAFPELGDAQPLGHHVVVRGWNEDAEAAALAGTLPDLKDAERTEVLAAHRRHKQTVVLLHMLATTLGAIAETDPTWIQAPLYSPTQHSFADRTRELITISLDDRLNDASTQDTAKKLIDAIEKADWGGWVGPDHDQMLATLRTIVDADKAGKTATDMPPAAYDQVNRIKQLAKQGDMANALAELDNILTAYPGNGALYQLKCELLLGKPGVGDKATRVACDRAATLAPGDPTPHIAVGEALAKTGDLAGARAELAQAEGKIENLPAGTARDDAWHKVIAIYTSIGALTWTEQALARAKLDGDPAAASVAQTRARYGVPRGTKIVKPEQEGALVTAIKSALDLVYASKYGEAERALAAAQAKWPGAPGIFAARCDLAFRSGQFPAAREACRRALASDPDESWALYLSGVLALKEESTTRAGIAQLKRAITIDPELAQAWHTLAKAYDRARDTAALRELAQAYQDKFGKPLPR